MNNDQVMFVGQKAFIEKGGEILTLTDPKLGLDFPGGKIKEGETDLVEAILPALPPCCFCKVLTKKDRLIWWILSGIMWSENLPGKSMIWSKAKEPVTKIILLLIDYRL